MNDEWILIGLSVLAEKANTSVQMINSVYDQPEQLKRMATRRSYLDNLDSDT